MEPTCYEAIDPAERRGEFWETYIQLTVVERAFRVLERAALAAHLAPLQRADASPCDGVRPGLRPLENA